MITDNSTARNGTCEPPGLFRANGQPLQLALNVAVQHNSIIVYHASQRDVRSSRFNNTQIREEMPVIYVAISYLACFAIFLELAERAPVID